MCIFPEEDGEEEELGVALDPVEAAQQEGTQGAQQCACNKIICLLTLIIFARWVNLTT